MESAKDSSMYAFWFKKNQEPQVNKFHSFKQEIKLKSQDLNCLSSEELRWNKNNQIDIDKYKDTESVLFWLKEEFHLYITKNNPSPTELKISLLYAIYLHQHALAYGHTKDTANYANYIKRLKIQLNLLVEEESAQEKHVLLEYSNKKIVVDKVKFNEEWTSFFATPMHSSGIRDWVGIVNIERIALVCAKVTITLAASLTTIFTDLPALLATTDAFYALSVALYALRLVEENIVAAIHIFFPNELVKASTTYWERFVKEVKNRHIQLLNDIAWGTINFLTNYMEIVKLTAPVANYLLIGFLIFDVLLVTYNFGLAWDRYQSKRMEILLDPEFNQETDQWKLEQLDLNWQIKCQSMKLNVVAALVVLAGFAGGLFAAVPIALPFCFAICVVGIALYLSVDKYENYLHEKHLYKTLGGSREALSQAETNLSVGFAKQVVMPLLIVAVFAINWPAGLALALTYLIYEGTNKYFETIEKEPPEIENSPLLSNEVTLSNTAMV